MRQRLRSVPPNPSVLTYDLLIGSILSRAHVHKIHEELGAGESNHEVLHVRSLGRDASANTSVAQAFGVCIDARSYLDARRNIWDEGANVIVDTLLKGTSSTLATVGTLAQKLIVELLASARREIVNRVNLQ